LPFIIPFISVLYYLHYSVTIYLDSLQSNVFDQLFVSNTPL